MRTKLKKMHGFQYNGHTLQPPPTVPIGSTPPIRAAQKRRRAKTVEALFDRSEQKWQLAILKKFGRQRAIEEGAPEAMIKAYDREKARELDQRRQKLLAKRKRAKS